MTLLTQTAPDLAIGVLNSEDLLEILDGGRELVLGAQDTRNGKHCRDRVVVETEGALVGLSSTLEFAHHFRHASCYVLDDAFPEAGHIATYQAATTWPRSPVEGTATASLAAVEVAERHGRSAEQQRRRLPEPAGRHGGGAALLLEILE